MVHVAGVRAGASAQGERVVGAVPQIRSKFEHRRRQRARHDIRRRAPAADARRGTSVARDATSDSAIASALWPGRSSGITLVATMQLPIVSHALLVAAVATASGLPAQGNSKPAPFWQSTAPFEMTLTVNLKKVSEKCLGRSTI